MRSGNLKSILSDIYIPAQPKIADDWSRRFVQWCLSTPVCRNERFALWAWECGPIVVLPPDVSQMYLIPGSLHWHQADPRQSLRPWIPQVYWCAHVWTHSALGRPNLWLSIKSSLCLLMNTLWSIILESILFRICVGAGGCLYMVGHMIDQVFIN